MSSSLAPASAEPSYPLSRLTQLEALFEHSLDAIVVIRPEGTVIDANPAACRLHRVRRDELVGGHLLSVVPGVLHNAVLEGLTRLLNGDDEMGEAIVLDSTGQEIPVEIRAAPFEYDGESAVLLQVRDVRVRKAAEAEARRQQELLRHVVENTPVLLFAVSADGEVTLAVGRGLEAVLADPSALMGTAYRSLLNLEMALPLRSARNRARHGQPAVCQVPVGNRNFECWVIPDGDGFIGVASDQTELINARVAAETLGDQLRALAQFEHKALEEERARISREAHDVLGQALTAIRIETDQIERTLTRLHGDVPEEVETRLYDLRKLADETLSNVRRIATELRPSLLDDLGLGAALAWKARDYARLTGIPCAITGDDLELPLSPEQAIALYRVTLELLTNVTRHAEAKQVYIRLALEDATVVVEVQDDGKGISSSPNRPQSLGVLGMRERLRPHDGTLEYASTPGGGTTATVFLPLAS